MSPTEENASKIQIKASQLLRKILMSYTCDKGIESNVVFMVGAISKTTFITMVHLVATKSSEVAVFRFVQKILTSFVNVMRYSQMASTDPVVSTHVQAHMAQSPT